MAKTNDAETRRTAHEDTALPVPVEDTRQYIQITPTDDPLHPDTVETQFRRLHKLDTGSDQGRIRSVFASDDPPTIEVRLVSPGAEDTPLRYLFGINDEDALDSLERILRGVFPDTYELDTTRRPTDPLQTHGNTTEDDTTDVAAVKYRGRAQRRTDWQTRLTPFETFHEDTEESHTAPLTAIAETMATADCPMVYQALLQPYPDWSAEAEMRQLSLERGRDTLVDQLWDAIAGAPDPEDISIPPSDQTRIAEIDERDTRRSFVVTARLAARETPGSNAKRTVRELASAFAGVSHTTHEIEGRVSTGTGAEAVYDRITERTHHPPTYEGMKTRLPFTTNTSRGIVADASEAPSFCLLGGDALTAAGIRAVGPTPGERTAIPRPPVDLLENYRGDGLLLGTPLTQDGSPDDQPLVLPPTLQPLHVGIFGKTGSGKTVAFSNAVLANNAATDGADIVTLPKGAGAAIELLRAYYATHGTLENVLYFDCEQTMPALSFFDIRDELDAGIPRRTAVENTADHYAEIVGQIMGDEEYARAIRSTETIRYLIRALFDPVSGKDAYPHSDLYDAANRLSEDGTHPPVVNENLEQMLAGVLEHDRDVFTRVIGGVRSRLEKIKADERIATVFNHVPTDESDPHFDLADYLDEDVLIVFDTGGMSEDAQRILTLALMSNLWSALRRRARRSDGDDPLVNLYVDEAGTVAASNVLDRLLAQARGFDCSVTLASQFPAQLRTGSDQTDADNVLNNISTFVTGNVPIDRPLARRLATDDMTPQDVSNRLRALRRGQWLVSLPAGFDEPEPRPFLVRSASPPPGHPAGSQPLTAAQRRTFDRAIDDCSERTEQVAGLTVDEPTAVETEDDADETDRRADSALPYTQRLPPTVEYQPDRHVLACVECESRLDPDIDGMRAAIECCGALERVDPDDVPVCELNLKLAPSEREASDYTTRQLLFLKAVYDAQQLRYDPLEYDLVRDSMLRLQEYVGIDSDSVQDLIDDGLVTHDTDRPHKLYSVTPDGRQVIGERYTLGQEYGHGKGDLEETSEHVLGVQLGIRLLEREYVDDPDSAVVEVGPYFDLDEEDRPAVPMELAMGEDTADLEEAMDEYDHRRLDIAGLDEDGRVVVAVEVERVNHDLRRAAPADFDKMAACDPEAAIWIAMSHTDAHEILAALNDPLEGDPRVEKTYADSTPVQLWNIDTPGCTDVVTVKQLLDEIEEDGDRR